MKIAYQHGTMETLAITVWNGIVSPLYDAACSMLVLRPDHRQDVFDVRNLSIAAKAEFCAQKGASVLICGAISTAAGALLAENNIAVISWIRGPVADIINAYAARRDLRLHFAMPGCGRRRCGRTNRSGEFPGGIALPNRSRDNFPCQRRNRNEDCSFRRKTNSR